jgi:hypothetical protein
MKKMELFCKKCEKPKEIHKTSIVGKFNDESIITLICNHKILHKM